MDSRIKKKTCHGTYMEHLIKWKDQPESEVTWIDESDFGKKGIPMKFLQIYPP